MALPQAPSVENTSSTLSAGITDIATSFDISDASNFTSPGYYVIDRVDSAGALKNVSLWEYVKVTNISSNTLTVTRGQGGSDNQAHSSGAVIEAVPTAAMFAEWYDALNPEHTASGTHILSTVTVTTHLSIGSASTSGQGLSLNPVWIARGTASGATVNVAQLIMPRAGTFKYFSATTRTPVSGASLSLALYTVGSGASIFDTIGRPVILGGGTFVSTASIKAPNFTPGQVIRLDIETGGNVNDITLLGSAY